MSGGAWCALIKPRHTAADEYPQPRKYTLDIATMTKEYKGVSFFFLFFLAADGDASFKSERRRGLSVPPKSQHRVG